MSRFTEYSDDYYINLNLNTEMDLPTSRETVLHFFDQLRRLFPGLRNFTHRERGEMLLEEDKDGGSYRWISLEARRLSSGFVNPTSPEEAMKLHSAVLEVATYALSISSLDCESLNITYGFDFNYRGNHHQLLVDALGISQPLEKLVNIPGAAVLACDPILQLALDEDCRTQVRLTIEGRTNAFQVRTREFSEEQISVYFTARRYGNIEPSANFPEAVERLGDTCRELVENYVLEPVLQPLKHAIAMS